MASDSKNLNLIFYRIGEGGNFLTRLFSLSDTTQFLWKTGTCGCRPKDHSLEEKLKYYSYRDDMQNWMADAHMTPSGAHLLFDIHNNWETNPTIITCFHYHHFIYELESYKQFGYAFRDNIKEKFFHIKISDNLYDNMRDQIKVHNADKIEYVNEVINTVNSEPIDMDLLTNSDETFIEEYTRVCGLMNLVPINTDVVLKFYNDWKRLRPIVGKNYYAYGFK